MDNLILKLTGGMGNQMLLYTFGSKIASLTGRSIILDNSFLELEACSANNFTPRKYDLDLFSNVNEPLVPFFPQPYTSFTEDITASPSKQKETLNQILNCTDPNLYINGGCWASKYYWEDFFETGFTFDFKHNIEPISFSLFAQIKATNSVMINIRRTDYLNGDFHGTYGVDYVKKGIEYISKHITNPSFFIFSDDVEWCQNNLSDIPNSFIVDHSHKGVKFSNYLRLMSSCKHFIIPNSTFAWWAAALAPHKDKIIVCPHTWIKGLNITSSDIMLDNRWTAIEAHV